MRYSLLLYAQEPQDAQVSDEDLEHFQVAFDMFGRSLDSAGVLVAAEVPQPVAATTSITRRRGEVEVDHAPASDSRETLSGIFIIEVPDLDAAVGWAQKCPGSLYGVVEVRPSGASFYDGHWHSSG